MKPKVFVTRKIPEVGLKMLEEFANIKVWQGELPPSREVILEEIKEVDGIVSLLTDKIDEEVMMLEET